MLLYIMNKISGMQLLMEPVRAQDKAKDMTHPHGLPFLPPHALDALIHLLERVDALPEPHAPHPPPRKRELKFYARTTYLALAVREGDSIASQDTVTAIEDSSYYLAHKCCLNPSEFTQFLSSAEVLAKSTFFLSQQHQRLEACLSQLLGPNGKLSTPFDFAGLIATQLSASSFEGLLDCLIEFALTVPETAQLSSEEIFVGCCLLVAEKANSNSLSSLLVGNFGSAMGKGGQLMALMKQLFASINADT